MKYFTETIPITLAKKLKEAGMLIETEGDNIWCPSYAEVLDYLWNKGVGVNITDESFTDEFGYHNDWWSNTYRFDGSTIGRIDLSSRYMDSWHKAANAAIEMALTLI